ncbi:MAG: sugar phosphate isomerase/epimerase family protein [Promethearchaeota archaeon]
MKLGISSLGHIIELASNKKVQYNNLIDLLFDASEACLIFAEENNFKVCELIIDPPDIFTNEKKKKFAELCKSFSIEKQIHGPFIDMGLASHNDFISEASINSYIETAKICKDINAEILTIHPGLANYLINSIRGYNKIQLIKAVNSLLDSIANLNLKICIENMPKNTNLLLNEDDIEEFFIKMNRDDIFLTYDTSHFWTCNGDIEKLWSKFHNVIKNIHIVDNDNRDSDKHPALGAGKINFKEIFDLIKKYEYKGALIIELSTATALPSSIDYIKKFI